MKSDLIPEDYAVAIAKVIAERVWFYVGEFGITRPAFYDGEKYLTCDLSVSERLWREEDGLNRKKFLVVFGGGLGVKIELCQHGPITANNPPIINEVVVHGLLQPNEASGYPRRRLPARGGSFQTWTFNKYEDGEHFEAPKLRERLKPFMPDFKPYYEIALQRAEVAA